MTDNRNLKLIASLYCKQYDTDAKLYIDEAHASGQRHLAFAVSRRPGSPNRGVRKNPIKIGLPNSNKIKHLSRRSCRCRAHRPNADRQVECTARARARGRASFSERGGESMVMSECAKPCGVAVE